VGAKRGKECNQIPACQPGVGERLNRRALGLYSAPVQSPKGRRKVRCAFQSEEKHNGLEIVGEKKGRTEQRKARKKDVATNENKKHVGGEERGGEKTQCHSLGADNKAKNNLEIFDENVSGVSKMGKGRQELKRPGRFVVRGTTRRERKPATRGGGTERKQLWEKNEWAVEGEMRDKLKLNGKKDQSNRGTRTKKIPTAKGVGTGGPWRPKKR